MNPVPRSFISGTKDRLQREGKHRVPWNGMNPVPNRGRETTNMIYKTEINITNNMIGRCAFGARALFGTG